MNTDNEKLLHQLEQATAADLDSDAVLDEETQALRDSWVAMGDLLDSHQPSTPLPMPQEIATPPTRSHVLWWAIAASLMLAASALWIYNQVNQSWTSSTQIAQDSLDTPQDPSPKPQDSTFQPQEPIIEPPTNDLLAWDDSLDEDISSFNTAVTDLERNWYGNNGDVRSMYNDVEEFSTDINGTSL